MTYEASGSSSSGCVPNHYWVSYDEGPFEGQPCACGEMLWHKETCPHCNQDWVRPKLANPKELKQEDL